MDTVILLREPRMRSPDSRSEGKTLENWRQRKGRGGADSCGHNEVDLIKTTRWDHWIFKPQAGMYSNYIIPYLSLKIQLGDSIEFPSSWGPIR